MVLATAIVRVVLVALLLAEVSSLAAMVVVVHGPVLVPLIPHLVSDLPALFAAAELPLRLEPVVPVHSDRPAVDHRLVEQVDSQSRLLPPRVLYEAKAARLLGLLIQAHDQIDHLAALTENIEQLAFQRKKGQVSNVERG